MDLPTKDQPAQGSSHEVSRYQTEMSGVSNVVLLQKARAHCSLDKLIIFPAGVG